MFPVPFVAQLVFGLGDKREFGGKVTFQIREKTNVVRKEKVKSSRGAEVRQVKVLIQEASRTVVRDDGSGSRKIIPQRFNLVLSEAFQILSSLRG
jgi:hypothetical protein